MRLTSVMAAMVLLCVEASSAHRHLHRRHTHSHFPRRAHSEAHVEKRGSTCSLPDDSDLQFVPGGKNGGFAMSPDQPCKDGMYCPIACKPGKVMAQWEPDSTYDYPSSMNGGLYCDGGKARKPFDDSPYCVDGTGTVSAVNKAGKKVSFCQTVLPGNEAMLIPTVVDSSATLAVPDPSYWGSTAAHYYINPPGTGSEGCIWGDNSKPIGNWAPYVTGANTDKSGQTFVKLGFNPIFQFEGAGLEKKPLGFGVRIECPDGGCNGLPCELNPDKKKLGDVVSDSATEGAGGSSFCVVTVPSGSKANVVVFNTGDSDGDYEEPEAPADDEDDDKDDDNDEDEDEDDDDDDDDDVDYDEPTTSSAPAEPSSSKKTEPDSTSRSPSPSYTGRVGRPGIFREKGDDIEDSSPSSTSSTSPSQTSSESEPSESEPNENEAPGRKNSAAIAGLAVAVAAAACFY